MEPTLTNLDKFKNQTNPENPTSKPTEVSKSTPKEVKKSKKVKKVKKKETKKPEKPTDSKPKIKKPQKLDLGGFKKTEEKPKPKITSDREFIFGKSDNGKIDL